MSGLTGYLLRSWVGYVDDARGLLLLQILYEARGHGARLLVDVRVVAAARQRQHHAVVLLHLGTENKIVKIVFF